MTTYILKLVGNKYYVGKSKNPKRRLKEHRDGAGGKGAEWTKLHAPLPGNCQEIREGEDEDVVTIEQMRIYEIDNVRGGSFCNKDLSTEEISIINLCMEHGILNIREGKVDLGNLSIKERKVLKKLTNTLNDLCHKCQGEGHQARNCPKCSKCNKYGHKEDDCSKSEENEHIKNKEDDIEAVEVNITESEENNIKYIIYFIIIALCCPFVVIGLCCYCFCKICIEVNAANDIERNTAKA